RRDGANQGYAAARDNAFLDCSAGCVESVFNASLLLLQLGLSGCANLDDGNATDQLGQPLLQLFLVVVGGGLLDLRTDFLHAAFDVGSLAGAVNDGGVVLVDGDALCLAEILELDAFELDAEILSDGIATGENRDIAQDGLATIAETGSL